MMNAQIFAERMNMQEESLRVCLAIQFANKASVVDKTDPGYAYEIYAHLKWLECFGAKFDFKTSYKTATEK